MTDFDDFDYTSASKHLYETTLTYALFDPATLKTLHARNLQRFKTFANGDAVLYENRNPHGNAKCSAGLRSSARSAQFSACCASRNRFIEKAKSNPQLKYFFTGTFDPCKNNLDNTSEILTRLTRFFRRRNIDYMLVAEPHKSGQIHFHGLLSQNVSSLLEPFDTNKPLPHYILNYLKAGNECFNFPAYAKNFGYVSVAPIRDFNKTINYVSKYITKSFAEGEKRFFTKRFICSQGLNMPQFADPSKIDFAHSYRPVAYSRYTTKVFLSRVDSFTVPPASSATVSLPCTDKLPPTLKRVAGFSVSNQHYIVGDHNGACAVWPPTSI